MALLCGHCGNFELHFCAYAVCPRCPLLFVPARSYALSKYIPESPYYLLKCGRPNEALAVLRTIARWNGTSFPNRYRLVVEHVDDDLVAKRGFREALERLFSDAIRRTTVCLCIGWFTINFGFFGFNMFLPQVLAMKGVAVDSLFLDVFLYTAAGLPGAVVGAVLIESRFGRKWTLSTSTLFTGVSMLLFVFTHTRLERVVFQCIVSALAQVMWAALFTFTPELFPTGAIHLLDIQLQFTSRRNPHPRRGCVRGRGQVRRALGAALWISLAGVGEHVSTTPRCRHCARRGSSCHLLH